MENNITTTTNAITSAVNNNSNSLPWIITGSVIAVLGIAITSGYLLLRKLGYFPRTINMTAEEYEKRKAYERKEKGIDDEGGDIDETEKNKAHNANWVKNWLESTQQTLDRHSKMLGETDDDIKELQDSNTEQEKRLDVLEQQYVIIDIVGTFGVRIAQECLRTVDQGIEEMHAAGAVLDASCAKTDELEKRKREVLEPLHIAIVRGEDVPDKIVYNDEGKENSKNI